MWICWLSISYHYIKVCCCIIINYIYTKICGSYNCIVWNSRGIINITISPYSISSRRQSLPNTYRRGTYRSTCCCPCCIICCILIINTSITRYNILSCWIYGYWIISRLHVFCFYNFIIRYWYRNTISVISEW